MSFVFYQMTRHWLKQICRNNAGSFSASEQLCPRSLNIKQVTDIKKYDIPMDNKRNSIAKYKSLE